MLAPGTRFAHYEIGTLLGAGGMGEVYRARDSTLGRDVAVKVLPAEVVADESARRRLLREARLAAQLNHPHICTVYEVGEADGLAYIAMELVDGRPLDQLVRPRGLPVETAVRYGIQIADALASAHQRGVVHRDLKCANILITADDRVKLLDFGLARRSGLTDESEATRTLTATDVIAGTPQYMAPEVLRGGEADARSDLWSFGVVLYEMAGGTRPFRGATSAELAAAILNEPPEPLAARVPEGLAVIIERCLAKDPAQRYRQAGEVRAALEGLAAARTGARSTLSAVGRRPAAPRRAAWIGVAAGALVLLAAALLLVPNALRSRLLGARGGPRVTSLAVLPLDNFSRDPGQQYFADGMTEELITTLAQMGGLRVISRTSVMGFKGTTRPLPEIGRQLGVDAIVEGSVQRSGDRVRITAQLIRAASDEHLWAQSYERDMKDVLALQDEVARAIATEVQGRLAPAPSPATAAARTVSPQAYDLYLRALEIYRRWAKQSDRVAVRYLNEALAQDSTYAPAWAALGLVYLDDPGIFGTREQDVARARQWIDRALALDPNLGIAYAAKGAIEYDEDWNWAGAERDLRRAIELSPNLFEAHHTYSHLLMTTGRPRQSLEEARAALALDPLNPGALLHMGWYDFNTGQYEQAIRQFHAALAVDPGFGEAYRFLSGTHLLTGRYEEAVAEQRKAIELSGASDTTSSVVPLRSRVALAAVIAARRGQAGEARRLLAILEQAAKRGTEPAYDLATINALMGRNDEAFRWLERAVASHEEYVVGLGQDPYMAGLRTDPRFAALLRRLGMGPLPAAGT